MNVLRSLLFIALVLNGAGCALTMAGFHDNRMSLSDTEVCLGVRAALNSGNQDFVDLATGEAKRRRISSDECRRLREAHDRRAAAAAVAALAIFGTTAAIVAASNSSSAGGYSSGGGGYVAPKVDYDWAWDGFYESYGKWVWSCRGIQTGRFANLDRCRYKAQNDYQWPSQQPPY